MQLSARILTALAVLAFTVAVVAGSGVTKEVSAATGTIDALNVGACTTTNADDFSLDNCTQPKARYQQDPLEDLIEVDSLYATYAHDPKTGAESPRAIITDGDLLRISITDKGRDRRDPVLITTAEVIDVTDENPFIQDLVNVGVEILKADADPDTPAPNAKGIVAEAVDVKPEELPPLEQQVQFDEGGTGTTFATSGTFEAIWEREVADTDKFKPIASRENGGLVKFFGRVKIGADPYQPFTEISKYVSLDEDVISGEEDTSPVMTLNISVPAADESMVQLQLIYYETSGIEYIQGNDKCFDDPDDTADNMVTTDVDELVRSSQQAACTSEEIGEDGDESDNDRFVLHAESDEDAADDKRHLALIETGRFTGTFQGYLRLTDADGNGGGDNWGLEKKSGEFTDGQLGDGVTADELFASRAVLGVGDGPITVTYQDTDGQERKKDIQIDIDPPTIQIDSPAHNGRSDDEKPSFLGSFNDSDSGLAAETFQLIVDNTNDIDPDEPVISIPSEIQGTVEEKTSDGKNIGQVRRRLDYTGVPEDSDATFGVIEDLSKIYKVELTINPKDYKSIDADDFADGSPDGEFNGELEIDFDEFEPFASQEDFEFNNAVDFQASVRDLAGNIGFSDSDATKPRFIDALGEDELEDRQKGPATHNVLGVFSRHFVHIDDKDPVIVEESSVTGFYGLDDENLVRDRSAVMVVFDNAVNGSLIDTGTFSLEHDESSAIAIEDVSVNGKLVFLKLGEELASDARPTLSITESREVEDLAGNVLGWQEEDAKAFQVQDGILPVFTLSLSGGSGTGVGSEGPSKLTNAAMDIAIASDEDINGSPRVAVVCANIGLSEDEKFGLGKYIANRSGADVVGDSGTGWECGSASQSGGFRESASLSRPGNNWVYAWRNASDDSPQRLKDNELAVVVWGTDRSTYVAHDSDKTQKKYGSATTRFVLDNTFNSPLFNSGGSVQPENGSKVKEPRPFVYLDFAGEGTSVTVTELTVDDEDVLSSLSSVGDNRFLYWPEALDFGEHKVVFDAHDAADNELADQSFKFDVTARDPFVIDLTAGWNAISFPANPIDTALDAVFTDEAIDRVVGWNPLSATGPWSIASRVDGVWTTSANFAPLTDVVVRYGYWVHSMAFIKQSVDLEGPINRETGESPHPVGIQTVPGWNFVGVVDQDGDQTEDDFGKTLQDSELDDVLAKDYMPGFKRAYTWDAIANGYLVLGGDGDVEIGRGIWVFFPDNTTVAP